MHTPKISVVGKTSQAKIRNTCRAALRDVNTTCYASMDTERKIYDVDDTYSVFDSHFIGMEIYRGPSMLDGQPIVVLATWFSCNVKTGPMIQISILNDNGQSPVENNKSHNDVSVCGNCPHRVNGTCYVAIFHGPRAAWQAWQNGRYAKWNGDARDFIGREIRWGMYGDPALIPEDIVAMLCDASDGWTGYTHQWRQEWASFAKAYFQASCDSVEDQSDAAADGWGTFTVLPVGYDRSNLTVKNSVCPASINDNIQCINCLHCNGACNRTMHKVIPAHGKSAARVTWDD